VPPSQIIDTVNIYHLPARHRKLSLRFLSWVVLQQDIQSSGTHDSIEDARTALQLFEQYQRMDVEGVFDEELEEIYREGTKLVRLLRLSRQSADQPQCRDLKCPASPRTRVRSHHSLRSCQLCIHDTNPTA
jgi:hypothetical protein